MCLFFNGIDVPKPGLILKGRQQKERAPSFMNVLPSSARAAFTKGQWLLPLTVHTLLPQPASYQLGTR